MKVDLVLHRITLALAALAMLAASSGTTTCYRDGRLTIEGPADGKVRR